MGNILFVFISIGLTIIGLSGLFLVGGSKKIRLSFVLVVLNSLLTAIPAISVINGQPIDVSVNGTMFFGDIPLRIDLLSAWFILIINITSITGAIYGIGYLKPYVELKSNTSLHAIIFPVFHLSMVLVCLVQHSLVFLIVWEIMSLSSLLLVIFEAHKKSTLQAGLHYLIQMHIGVAILTMAFLWVYVSEGSYDFKAIEAFFLKHSNVGLFIAFFIGFGIKAGFIPLHTWLPQAHPAAPSHISGIMSGVMVKVGVFGILRITGFLHQDYFIIGGIVLFVSILTGFYGIFQAAIQRNFKKMLAYCTIENIGIIGLGIGMGILGLGTGNHIIILTGFGGALLHVLNHSLFKSLLFYTIGAVYQQTHTRNIEKLGGLIKSMPQSAIYFLIGALAIGGLPPFNGFISEFLLYRGFLEGVKTSGIYVAALMVVSLASLAIIGGLSIITFTRSFGVIFLGSPRTKLTHQPQEASLIMRIPQLLIVLLMVSIGLFPGGFLTLVQSLTVEIFIKHSVGGNEVFGLNILSRIGVFSMVFLGLAGGLYYIRFLVIRKQPIQEQVTWGCAYTGSAQKMQYTGKSFSKSLTKLLGLMVKEEKKYPEISSAEIYPDYRQYASKYWDEFSLFINNITNRLLHVMNFFQFIQNGKIQMYILYGLIFIVLVFLGTVFNLI